MDYVTIFRDEYLSTEDLLAFATALNVFQEVVGKESCWCVKAADYSVLESFTVTHPSRPQFKGRDARVLSLALVDQFYDDLKPVIVRRHVCKSIYCVNPNHYYYGTRADVRLEHQRRSGLKLSLKIIDEIKLKREEDPRRWTYAKLASLYRLPVHVVGRICRGQSYDG